MLKLHSFGESGHSYKAALGLTFAGLDWEPVLIRDFFTAPRSADYLEQVNAMGEAPALDLGDGRVLTQSGVILDWIARETGAFAGPSDDPEVLRWVLFDNHKLSSNAGTARFMMNFLPEAKRNADVIRFVQGRMTGALRVLERHLASRDWIAGGALSAADLSCCSYLYYDEPFGFDRADWPAIDAWLFRISARPGWAHPYDLMTPVFPGARPQETPNA